MKIIRRGDEFEVIEGDESLPEGVPVVVYTAEDIRRVLGLVLPENRSPESE